MILIRHILHSFKIANPIGLSKVLFSARWKSRKATTNKQTFPCMMSNQQGVKCACTAHNCSTKLVEMLLDVSTVLDSIVVSIPACHAGDPGSIPGRGDFLFFIYNRESRHGVFTDQMQSRFWLAKSHLSKHLSPCKLYNANSFHRILTPRMCL